MRALEAKTGVDREVIRVLLRKGLIPAPRRPARNLAEYDETHVRAIAVVRELQKSGRMTLEQIGIALAGRSPGLDAGAATYRHLEELLVLHFGIDQSSTVSVAALSRKHGKAARDAQAFAEMGMVTFITTAAGPHLSLSDARLVEIWGQIRAAGFVEETGFPPENIAFYLEAAKYVAAMEGKVFLSGSAGRISEDAAAAMLRVALPLMLDFFGILRMKEFLKTIHLATSDGTVP